MSKGILRGIVLCLMVVAVIIVTVFIIKSNTEEKQYKSTVTIKNNQNIDNDSKNTYVDAKKEENIIDYAENHYFTIILFSTLSFVGLLVFYAFLSKKKEW